MQTETAVSFFCQQKRLIGILHQPSVAGSRGMLIIVGGPQYRVGSHRQFLLLARFLADRGVPVFRFDHRGMGDSEGNIRSFESLEDDIRSAIDCFQRMQPSLKRIALWGLCDAASAASFYAPTDPRIKGLVLLNPWVKSETGEAKTYLKHYYRRKLFDKETWRRVVRGDISFSESIKSLFLLVAKTAYSRLPNQRRPKSPSAHDNASCIEENASLADRMFDGLVHFDGKVLLILSGVDLTADEFRDAVNRSKKWMHLFSNTRFHRHTVSDADHTFSRAAWRKQVEYLTLDWIERHLPR